MKIELTTINTKIKSLGDAEKITKALLAELSRDLLMYVFEPVIEQDPEDKDGVIISIGENASYDIDAVNRTLSVLTPMNKKTAALYFSAMLPWNFDEGTCRFSSMDKNKKRMATKVELAAEFLENKDNNIWTWAAENVKVESKAIDYAKKIAQDVSKALDEDKGNMSAKEVLNAVLEGGLTGADILECLALLEGEDQQQAA